MEKKRQSEEPKPPQLKVLQKDMAEEGDKECEFEYRIVRVRKSKPRDDPYTRGANEMEEVE